MEMILAMDTWEVFAFTVTTSVAALVWATLFFYGTGEGD